MNLGPHAVYIWSSYAIVTIAVVGLIIWLFQDGKRQERSLADLEARGIRRRSAT